MTHFRERFPWETRKGAGASSAQQTLTCLETGEGPGAPWQEARGIRSTTAREGRWVAGAVQTCALSPWTVMLLAVPTREVLGWGRGALRRSWLESLRPWGLPCSVEAPAVAVPEGKAGGRGYCFGECLSPSRVFSYKREVCYRVSWTAGRGVMRVPLVTVREDRGCGGARGTRGHGAPFLAPGGTAV